MLQTYYLGDVIGARSISMMTLQYVFNGAKSSSYGWEIQLLVLYGQSIERCTFEVGAGGMMRFGKPFSLSINKDGREDKKKTVNASQLRIQQIEPDSLTVEFFED
jgi:hypothetical protein